VSSGRIARPPILSNEASCRDEINIATCGCSHGDKLHPMRGKSGETVLTCDGGFALSAESDHIHATAWLFVTTMVR
jgi:hypothetical protein